MASILSPTSTIGTRPLKPSSSRAREVRGKLERLLKENTSKGSEREAPQKERSKEPRGKEKVLEESQKKRKLVYVTSSSGKFGTFCVPFK